MSKAQDEQFPRKEGWIRMELTMTSKKALGEDHIKRIATFGKPGNYEFGDIEQHGAKVIVYLRETSARQAKNAEVPA